MNEKTFILPMPSSSTLVFITAGIVGILLLFAIMRKSQETRSLETYRLQRRNEIDRRCALVDASANRILVSLISYRNPYTATTLFSLFEQAVCPFRIHVILCDYQYAMDVVPLKEYKDLAAKKGVFDFSRQITVLSLSPEDARGMSYARHLIESKYKEEGEQASHYWLQVQAGVTLSPEWDEAFIETLHHCPSYHSILGLAVRKRAKDVSSFVCFPSSSSSSLPPSLSYQPFHRSYHLPIRNAWVGENFFTYASSLLPQDPYLAYEPDGVRHIVFSLRAYTHGCDVFFSTEPKCLLQNMQGHATPRMQEQVAAPAHRLYPQRTRLSKRSEARLAFLLGKNTFLPASDPPLGHYGLGSIRSREAFFHMSGVDFVKQTVSQDAKNGLCNPSSDVERLCKTGVLPQPTTHTRYTTTRDSSSTQDERFK